MGANEDMKCMVPFSESPPLEMLPVTLCEAENVKFPRCLCVRKASRLLHDNVKLIYLFNDVFTCFWLPYCLEICLLW